MNTRAGSTAGLGLALVSAATFGTSGAFAGSLLKAGWTPLSAVTVRVVVAALVLTPVALLALRGARITSTHARGLAVYGVLAVAGAQLCYFNAVQHLSVAVALLLEYSGVLLVVLWLWAREGRRPQRLTVLGAAVALAGLALVLDLTSEAGLDPVGVLWGLGAAVGLATYFVMSASGEEGALPPLVIAWGGLAVGGAVLLAAGASGLLPLAAPRVDVVLLGSEVTWLVPVLGLSLVAAVVAYVAGILGARLLGATLASFVGLTEVLFAVLFAYLLLGQVLAPVQLLGGLLVLGGVTLVRVDELRRHVPPAAPARQVVGAPEPEADGSPDSPAPAQPAAV